MTDHLADERIDAYLDDELDDVTRAKVDAHLAACDGCAAEVASLRALVAEVGALPAGIAPQRDLLPEINAAIDGLAVVPIRPAATGRAATERTLWSARWLLAAAAVVLVVLSSTTTALLVRRASDDPPPFAIPAAPSEVSRVEARFVAATAELEAALRAGELAPETVRILEENLAIIDRALDEARRALRDDPGNRALSEMLIATYEKKLELLRSAAVSVAT